nr:ATP-dependent RecD-like DNA helicase [Mesoterricola sediminis]
MDAGTPPAPLPMTWMPDAPLTPEPGAEPRREPLAGLVERVTFHNPDTGFSVLRVLVRGRREPVTVIGTVAAIQAGEQIQASGTWENHRDHGPQFKAAFLKATLPTTLAGIETYLGSGLIPGIGPVYAEKLVKAFGEQVFDLIESDPGRLKEIPGIGPVRARRIIAGWAEQKAVREIMLFLQSHGVSTARAVRIYKTYGADAIPLVTENPYRLAKDIRGIGFKSADQIARQLGIAPDSMLRARAGVTYALLEALHDGHCALPEDDLLGLAARLLELPREPLAEALAEEVAEGNVIRDTLGGRWCAFLPHLWRSERILAGRIRALGTGAPPWPAIDPAKALPWVEGTLGVTLAASQRAAVKQTLASKVMVITGGPGVGKTTLVNAILRILGAKGVEVALAAPTGRAAKRLSESTNLPAKTLHRLLEFDPAGGGFKRGPDHPLPADLVVVDEMSMVDVPMMASLLQAVPDRAAVLLVGDMDQLPSVGPGQVLADLIGSGTLPVTRLTEIFRQAAESRIIVNAHRINRGQMPEGDVPRDRPTDFYLVEADAPETAVARILEIVRHRIPARFGLDPVRDVQVLCPMNRGAVGARALNVALQEALNPGGPGQPAVERFGNTYRVGDKVMQIVNDYDKETFNGDIGRVAAVDLDAGEAAISFDGRLVPYAFGELDEIMLAYAASIHKSQGSEFPAVVIPVMTQHYAMLARNLLYTGVTRGRKLVVLVGQKKAVAIAVQGVKAQGRWSKLREWLIAGDAPHPGA